MKTYRGHFTSGNQWIGGWVSQNVGLDAVAKRKNPIIAPVRK